MRHVDHWKYFAYAIYGITVVAAIIAIFPEVLKRNSIVRFTPVAAIPVPFSWTEGPAAEVRENRVTRMYRGNIERHGTAAHEAVQASKLRQLWMRTPINVGLHSASKSSPAVDASGIYVGSDGSWMRAFDHSGKERWKFYVGNSDKGIHGTAALDETHVYFGSYNGYFYALRKADGLPSWILWLGEAIGASPQIVGPHIYIAVEFGVSVGNGFVAKIERATGKLVWKSPFLGEHAHSSTAHDRESGLLFVGSNNGFLTAMSEADGGFVWRYQTGGAVKSTPVVWDGKVFATSWSRKLLCLDADDGKLLWELEVGGRSMSSPTLVEELGSLYFGSEDGFLYSVDIRTGKVRWKRESGKAAYMASGLATRRAGAARGWILWFPCRNQDLCAWDPVTGLVLARYPLPARFSGEPAAHGGRIYVSANHPGGLAAFGP